MPTVPLPAPKQSAIRGILTEHGLTSAAIDQFLHQVSGDYNLRVASKSADEAALTAEKRREYIRRMSGLATELGALLDDMPEEVLHELFGLIGAEYGTSMRLLDELERMSGSLMQIQVAAGRMKHYPLRRGRPGTPGADTLTGVMVLLALESVGVECTAYAESAYERVLGVLLDKDPHRCALRSLRESRYHVSRVEVQK